jgi:flagellar basal body rod protein FlgG
MNALSLFSTGLAGLTAAEASFNTAASTLVSAGSPPDVADRLDLTTTLPLDRGLERPNVDVTADVVHLILAKHLYTASAQILRASDHLLGTLLDVTSSSN